MRFKLLCFLIPRKVAFVITLQYFAINISDTPWVSWHPHPCSRGGKVALLRVGLWSGGLEPTHHFIAGVSFGEGLFGIETNMQRGVELPQRPGDLCSRPVSATISYRSTYLSFKILIGKGKRPLWSCLEQFYSKWSACKTESQYHGLDLNEFGY